MTKSDDKRVPVLRFKGFTDEWEQRKLGEICKVTKLAGFEFTKYVNYSNTGSILAIRGINVKKGKFNLQDVKYIDNSNFSRLSRSKLQEGDILFTYVGTIGNSAIVPKNVNWYLAPNVCLIRPQDKNSSFISYLIQSDRFQHEEIPKWITTSSQPALSMENIRKFKIILPLNSEQQKISSLVSKIDKLITLQQRKVKLLELFRKAIHNNIFPEYGKETPVIRHKKFTNKWNVVKFNTIYKKSTEKNDLTYGEDKIISVAKMYFKQEKNKSSQDYLKTYNVFKIGDIAFEGNRSKGFSHGRFVQNTIGNGIVSHVFDVFTPIKKDNLKYWKYAIHNEHVMKYVLVKSTTKATMMNNLSSKDFLKQSIAVPSSEEMNTIAKILQDLDNQINITNNKINYLQNMKKFLLQNMFI